MSNLLKRGITFVFALFCFFGLIITATSCNDPKPQKSQAVQPQPVPAASPETRPSLENSIKNLKPGFVIFSSPVKFDVYNTTTNKKLMTAEKIPPKTESVVYIFEASINLFSGDQYAFKDIDQCWYLIDPNRVTNSPEFHYVIQNQGFERICGDWWATTNITAENGIFHSEVAELFNSEAKIMARIESPFWIDYEATPNHLRKNGDWRLVRGDGKIIARYANPMPSSALLKKSEPEDVNRFIEQINKLVDTVVAARRAELILPDSETLYTAFLNTIINFRDLAEWADTNPADSDKVMALLKLAKPLAKLITGLVGRNTINEYLLSLDWKKDIVSVDPRWYANWRRDVHENEDKKIPFFQNLSYKDVQVRLFWQRRGQLVFETVKQAVKDELAKK